MQIESDNQRNCHFYSMNESERKNKDVLFSLSRFNFRLVKIKRTVLDKDSLSSLLYV